MNNGFEQEFLMNAKESAAKDVENKSARKLNTYRLLGSIIAVLVIVIIVMAVILLLKNRELRLYTELYDDGMSTVTDEDEEEVGDSIEDIRKVLSCTYGGERAIGLYSDGSYSVIDLFASEELESGTYSTDWFTSVMLATEEGEERQVELDEGGLVDNSVRYECKKYEVAQ